MGTPVPNIATTTPRMMPRPINNALPSANPNSIIIGKFIEKFASFEPLTPASSFVTKIRQFLTGYFQPLLALFSLCFSTFRVGNVKQIF